MSCSLRMLVQLLPCDIHISVPTEAVMLLLWQAQIEQTVEVLQSHNKWLEEELSAKTEAVQQERRSVASQVGNTLLHPLTHKRSPYDGLCF